MKTWVAGAVIADRTSWMETADSAATTDALGDAELGPQLAMSRQLPPCCPGTEAGHEPHGGMGAFECELPPLGAPVPWWQSS